MKSIGKDKLFDYMYKNHLIYSTKVGYDKGNVGFTVFNPIDSIPDVFISNSLHLSKLYRSAFNYTGPIFNCGYPKNDCLFGDRFSVKRKVWNILRRTH